MYTLLSCLTVTPLFQVFQSVHITIDRLMYNNTMSSHNFYVRLIFLTAAVCLVCQCGGRNLEEVSTNQTAATRLTVDVSECGGRHIPETLFGVFFEEINHAGAGGLWAELVSNRGFEAGGSNVPSNIDPWSIIGNESYIYVETDRSSQFERNPIALRMVVFCGEDGSSPCPSRGVGIYNPGFWGMNIEDGKKYNVVFYVRSTGAVNVTVSFASNNGSQILASADVVSDCKWTKKEVVLLAKGTDHYARLELTTTTKGEIWFDQVSAMPVDTYKGHGFRSDLVEKIALIKPRFMRFPGGCFVEGGYLRNAFRWKETVGAWEERPGHYGDVWNYWTDDGLGHFEFFQLAEDLNTIPIWVFNNGISHHDEVETASILPFVQEALDGIEFARGDNQSRWGSVRAAMGHPQPFDLKYVAIGNEDCGKEYYLGNYLKFYDAIKRTYPDIKIISNCDGSKYPLDHPADFYDFHIYTTAASLFSKANQFDNTSRVGPKAFVSEYAVTDRRDAGNGSLLAGLAEAGYLIGLEKNSDVVELASYAPLFVNDNDRTWNPDAIVFDSYQAYGTPSFWMQSFFAESSGATLLNSTLQTSSSSLVASAIAWDTYIRIKMVNIGSSAVNVSISFKGSDLGLSGWKKGELTSTDPLDENSFSNPTKVTPVENLFSSVGEDVDVVLSPYSFTYFDFSKHVNTSSFDSSSRI